MPESVKGEGSKDLLAKVVGNLYKDIKIAVPKAFSGDRTKLKGFLIQVNLYLNFHKDRFTSDTERVLWVTTLLEGPALDWIKGAMTDYMTNSNKRGAVTTSMKKETQVLFLSYRGFVHKLQQAFGNVDDKKEAVRALQTLRQKGSAGRYAAKFQRFSTRTNWGGDALKDQFYRGLKDAVKDNLIKEGEFANLEAIINRAIIINNRN